MRLRIGLILAAVVATSLSTLSTPAEAFGGYSSAPLNVSATAIAGGIQVSWAQPTDVDTGITGYRVEYSTSGTDGTWILAASVSSATYSYDVVALSQVETYVRVAATTSSGTGTYGYPWTKLYSTIALNRNSSGYVTYESGFGVGASDPFTTLSGASFSRIRWRVDTTINSVTKYAEADAYEWVTGDSTKSIYSWGPTVASVMVPSVNSPYAYSVQANVSDLNVYSNNNAVTNGKGLDGRLEIWPWNYATGTTTLTGPTASGSKYDFDDTDNLNGSHGSFQIHDLTNQAPVFVWNDTGYGAAVAFNYGKNTNANGNPDWTFCSSNLSAYGSCPAPTSFKLQIFVNIPVTPLQDATAPTVSRVDARSVAKNGDTITVKSSEVGIIYLVNQSVNVANVASINSASASNKNSVAVSSANSDTTLTISSLSDGIYNLYAADTFTNLSSPVVATIKVDNSAPTATSISVNSAGTAIVISSNETITNSMQVYGWYAINDGTSSVTVTATAFSGTTATLTLARAIVSGATVTFAYSPLSGNALGRWIDAAGNEMAPITSRTITNSSGVVIAVNLSAPTTVSKGSSLTVTAVVPVAGKVTFTIAGKRIPGCLNKVATGTPPITVTCTFKGALSGRQFVTSTLVPTLNAYPTTSTTLERFFLKRTTLR